MLALALLLGLIVWVLITLAAIFIGTKLGKSLYPDNPKAGLYGALSGFMLTMGGFIVYWAVEYVYIQTKVSHLCESEGGVTVYVTPEEYRAQIGEDEWRTLKYIGDNIPYSKRQAIIFEDKEYLPSTQINIRIWSYRASDINKVGVNVTDIIYIDNVDEEVLFQVKAFSVSTIAIANSLKGLKFWMKNIKGCPFDNSMPLKNIDDRYSI